jgi:hypothetical protein
VFEAVGIGEVDDIEPVAGPAFAVARGGEETVDEGFPCGWVVGGRCVGVVCVWREACQVEVDASGERAGVGFG